MAGVISEQFYQRLMRMVTAWERSSRFGSPVGKIPFREALNSGSVLVRAPSGGIAARTTVEPPSENCWICKIDANDITVTSDTIQVFNWLTVDVMSTGSRLGFATQDRFGTWWATGDDCADSGEDLFEDPA